ncbi:hypothetical protein GCM10027569_85670 [Flindersiella endophytica]
MTALVLAGAVAVAAGTAATTTSPAPAEAAPQAVTALADKGTVGWETYRRLDRLPYLASGVQSLQVAGTDAGGGNIDDGNTRPCLASGGAGCVLAEDRGAGEIASIWATRYPDGNVTGVGTLRIELDGVTVVDANFQDVVTGRLGTPFVYPLVASSAQSSGGVYIKVPMTYRTSMRVSTQTSPGFYHVDYKHYPDAEGVPAFDGADQAQDVLAMLGAAGTRDPKPAAPDAQTTTRTVDVPAGGSATLAQLAGPASVSGLRIRLPGVPSAATLSGLRLRISFDGQATVDSPVGEFFGSGLGASDVRALLYSADDAAGSWYSTWWPMPFAQNAVVSLANTTGGAVTGVAAEVTIDPDTQWTAALSDGSAGYFTARSRSGAVTDGRDWLFADESGHGKFVGVNQTVRGSVPLSREYLEGDERVHVDGSLTPSWYGTGTEDYYESGWYFVNGRTRGPFAGNPVFLNGTGGCANVCDAMFRLMLADAIPYRTALRFGIEHGPDNNLPATYGSTAFLYQQATSATRRTDSIEVTDAASRTAHAYTDSGASEADVLSAYEGDDDNVPVLRRVRSTTQPLSFRLTVDGANSGVLLRRTSDQSPAYQSASVQVDGVAVGTWLSPLGNARQRQRADTFALPRAVTAGRTAVIVTLTPNAGSLAWNAGRYDADSLVPAYVDTAGPSGVSGLRVIGTRHGIRLSWSDAVDNAVVRTYRVYSSTRSDVPISDQTLIGTVRTPGFVHAGLPAGQANYYRVIAVDAAGNTGGLSGSFAGTTTKWLRSDLDRDGRDDVLTFTRGTAADVFAATSTGVGFVGDNVRWHDDFARGSEIPLAGDFNGDGRTDVVTFTRGTAADVYVALSNGSAFTGTGALWHDHFAVGDEIPAVGDFNGDGRDDIVTFVRGSQDDGPGPAGDVFVALSDGSRFIGDAIRWHLTFGFGAEVPQVGDFNGDGMDDVAVFTRGSAADVYVALSTGTRFTGSGVLWHGSFAGGTEKPGVGDFNGDGRDDVVTFTGGTAADVYVALSNGGAFTGTGGLWHGSFAGGTEVPGVGDFNGDGRSDVVTFARGDQGRVYVSLSDSARFVENGWLWHSHFGVLSEWPLPSLLTPAISAASTSTADSTSTSARPKRVLTDPWRPYRVGSSPSRSTSSSSGTR